MQSFHPSTTCPEEARALTATIFLAIATGWPIAYAKRSSLETVSQRLDLDTDAMLRDAADIAASLTHAVDLRLSLNSDGEGESC